MEALRRRIDAYEELWDVRYTPVELVPEQKQRHLRIVPIFAGITAMAGAIIGWAKAHPAPVATVAAAAAAAMTTALVVATTPEPRPYEARPDTPTTISSSSTSTGSSTTGPPPATTTTPTISPPGRVATDRTAAPTLSRQRTARPPIVSATATSPPTTTATDPSGDLDDPAPVGCLVRVEALGVIDLCIPTVRPLLL